MDFFIQFLANDESSDYKKMQPSSHPARSNSQSHRQKYKFIAALLFIAIFVLAIYYREDAAVLIIGNDVGDDNIIISRASNKSSNTDDDTYWNALVYAAEQFNFNCNGTPTSIHTTISAAKDIAVSVVEDNKSGSLFATLEFKFRAYDESSSPQKSGGDEFVLDYLSYWSLSSLDDNSTKYTVVKSSAFARDGLDGTYTARLFLPRHMQQHIMISLRHYYTCHEGHKLPDALSLKNGYQKLDFGPLDWTIAAEEARNALASIESGINASFFTIDNLPKCSESNSNEELLNGVWIEEQSNPPSNMSMTIEAHFQPLKCKLDYMSKIKPAGTHFRIGDSTMPGVSVETFRHGEYIAHRAPKIKMGLPYAPYLTPTYSKGHIQFLGVLRDQLIDYNQTYNTNDTFLYGGGLHHTFHAHFNVPATATLVIRTICQIGLTFPGGKIFLRGPNPIQQHLFPAVDQTSLNVRRINWELRSRLQKNGYKLAELCMSDEDTASFVFIPDADGNILQREEASPKLLERYNYSWERNSNADQKHLQDWIRGLTAEERRYRYDNRTVEWLDFQAFLLPRYEMYRENDKIHDSGLFWGPEWKMLDVIEERGLQGSSGRPN